MLPSLEKRVLFVGHDANRFGAQKVLLHLLEELKKNPDNRGKVLLGLKNASGPLLAEYGQLAPMAGESLEIGPPQGMRERIGRKLWGPSSLNHRALKRLEAFRPELICLNTVAALPLLEALQAHFAVPVVLHQHELEWSVRQFCGIERFRALLPKLSGHIAVSRSVWDFAGEQGLSGKTKSQVVYPFAPLPEGPNQSHETERLRQEMGISPEAKVVGACGGANWRKGTDWFLQVAARLQATVDQKLCFLWVGDAETEEARIQYAIDAKKLGLEGRFFFTGWQTDTGPYFRLMEAFAMPSREDPFPLVCLEATAAGVPVVSFEDSGGIPEVFSAGAGLTSPYGDTGHMATNLAYLLHQPAAAQQMAETAGQKLAEKCSPEVGAKHIVDFLNEL